MSGYRDKEFWAWNGEIGPFLEEARERRGISLKEAEQSTRIRSRYLEGLERENPRVLPGRGYVQGFLRSYAEFLGLDVEELSRRFKRHDGGRRHRREQRNVAPAGGVEHEEATRPGEQISAGGRGLRGGALRTLSLAVLTLALVVAAFYILRDDPLSEGAPISGRETPAENNPDGSGPEGPPQAGEPAPTLEEDSGREAAGREGRLRATVLVRGSESWISVESESGVEYTGIAQPGFSRSFESGESFSITTGNAGAIELRLNGIDYGTLGENGEVTSRSFTLKLASQPASRR